MRKVIFKASNEELIYSGIRRGRGRGRGRRIRNDGEGNMGGVKDEKKFSFSYLFEISLSF